MNLIFWMLLLVVLLAIFGGAVIVGAAWIAWYALVGIVIGALARLLVPDSTGFGLARTILCGLIGSMLGGVIAHAADLGTLMEFLASVLVAAVVIAIAARSSRPAR